AENYYYLKQMNKKLPVAIVFIDGETVEGVIEWYDRNCIKLNREKDPNLLVYKRNIKYIHKLEETDEQP
ncbi:MAG: RNA chaperone Hfq, partial [Acidobacteria bacterium]|nr:RNA chaperone Hfq [Acidobacteriota bacterium]